METIGGSAFYQCNGITGFTVDPDNGRFTSEDGVLFDSDATTLINYPLGSPDRRYTVPGTVTAIGTGAFSALRTSDRSRSPERSRPWATTP